MLPPGSEQGNRPTYEQTEEALDIVVARAKKAGKIKTSEEGYRRAIRSSWTKEPDRVFEVLNLKPRRRRTVGGFPEYDYRHDGAQSGEGDERIYLSLLDWMETRPELSHVLERLVEYERRHGPHRRTLLQQTIRAKLERSPAATKLGERFWTLYPVVEEERRRFLFGLGVMFQEEE